MTSLSGNFNRLGTIMAAVEGSTTTPVPDTKPEKIDKVMVKSVETRALIRITHKVFGHADLTIAMI